MDDIATTVKYAAQSERLMQDIRVLFQGSDEVRALTRAFHPDVHIYMKVESSRKYTRYEFPYCPTLMIDMVRLLAKHSLLVDPQRHIDLRSYKIELATIRIGVNEIIRFGEQECPSPPSTN